jgi:uncharacterized membrane protein
MMAEPVITVLAIAACGLYAAAFRRTESDSNMTEARSKNTEPLGSAVLFATVVTSLTLNFAVESESALPPLLFYTTLSFLAFYCILVYTPWLLMRIVINRMKKTFKHYATNSFYHCQKLSTAADRAIVKPCPDLLYSMASIDFAEPGVRAVKISMEDSGTYSSMSFFSDSTDNFYVTNFDSFPSKETGYSRRIKTVIVFGPSEISIDLEKAKKLLGVDDAIRCPSIKAAVLQRIFVPAQDMIPQLRNVQENATCTPLFEWPDSIKKAEGATNNVSTSRFSTPGSGFAFVAVLCFLVGFLLSDFQQLVSVWKSAAACLVGILAVPLSLSFLFAPWIKFYMPVAMRSVSLGCWNFNPKCGGQSADSFVRSWVALTGLLALNKNEAIYMMGTHDIDRERLDCRNDYVITCPKTMPGAWWSITAYAGDHYLIPNDRGVYSYSHQSAKQNPDGTITIYWSSKKPKGEILNWLPAGDSEKDSNSQLILRLYKPHEALRNATVENEEELCKLFRFPVIKRVVS